MQRKSQRVQLRTSCTTRLDRLRIAVSVERDARLPIIRKFRVVRDCFVRQQTSARTYLRCRSLLDPESGTQVFWQYRPQHRWLAPWRITFIAEDRRGLLCEDLEPIVDVCDSYRILLAELALDFGQGTGIDEEFVLEHSLFGKSRPRIDRGGIGQLRYGTRFSDKLVRAYPKPAVNAYRLELELHARLLRSARVNSVLDLPALAEAVHPVHLQFVAIRWDELRAYLLRKFPRSGLRVLSSAESRAASIHVALSYLRGQGVNNVHRFLVPVTEKNNMIRQALRVWSAAFRGENDVR